MGLFIKRGSSLVPVGSMIKTSGTITDLTGTTWTLQVDGVVDMGILVHGGEYDAHTDITFISNNTQFTGMGSNDYSENELWYRGTDPVDVQDISGWIASDAYKTIAITGGADATNATLINWFYNNATLVAGGPSVKRVALDIQYQTTPSLDAPVIELETT